jgi:hypothetical protein
MDLDKGDEGLEWQIGVWDQISDLYLHEIDRRLALRRTDMWTSP